MMPQPHPLLPMRPQQPHLQQPHPQQPQLHPLLSTTIIIHRYTCCFSFFNEHCASFVDLLTQCCTLYLCLILLKCFTTKEDLRSAVDACASPTNQGNADCTTIKDQYGWPMNDWCFDGITDMAALFVQKSDFNEDISNWNTAGVTIMNHMFFGAQAFNQPIGGWNTGSVTTMESMFQMATAFNQDISGWNTASVTVNYGMNMMFGSASSFNQNLCAWRDNNFPYDNCRSMFANSGCTHTADPTAADRGPFCESDCNVSIAIVVKLMNLWSFINSPFFVHSF